MSMTDEEYRKAFIDGFMSSGEGHNGEYMHSIVGRPTFKEIQSYFSMILVTLLRDMLEAQRDAEQPEYRDEYQEWKDAEELKED